VISVLQNALLFAPQCPHTIAEKIRLRGGAKEGKAPLGGKKERLLERTARGILEEGTKDQQEGKTNDNEEKVGQLRERSHIV